MITIKLDWKKWRDRNKPKVDSKGYPHIHTLYKLGPCPICGQTNWKNDQETMNHSRCQVCGAGFYYPYAYRIEEANSERLKALGITPYGEIAKKEWGGEKDGN